MDLLLLFYDEKLRHRLTKRVGNVEPETLKEILEQAEAVRLRILPNQYDFMAAKAAVMRRTSLSDRAVGGRTSSMGCL